ncbi:MAG: hypothetical protein DIU60_023815 [Actinomycetes bacterium]
METTQYIPADMRERVLKVLTEIEWAGQVDHPDGGWYSCCPWCQGGDPEDDETPPDHAGHAVWCQLAAVLALLRTTRGEGEAEPGASLIDELEGEHWQGGRTAQRE